MAYWEVPEDFHPRLEQAAIPTKRGADNPVAKAYLDFLRSLAARPIIDRYGFQLPAQPWLPRDRARAVAGSS